MKRPPLVLLVDDDPHMVRTLELILKLRGYEVLVAHSGEEALALAKSRAINCVVSDIRMPGMDGVELYRAIKARRTNTPVVLMTAYSADALVDQGLEEGAAAVLTKPVDIDELLGLIASLIGPWNGPSGWGGHGSGPSTRRSWCASFTSTIGRGSWPRWGRGEAFSQRGFRHKCQAPSPSPTASPAATAPRSRAHPPRCAPALSPST